MSTLVEEASKEDFYRRSLVNRYKVSKFRRDRAVELHATEVQEYPQYRLRIHQLSGKRLLCHCRATEKCHTDNLRDLFREQDPQAYDPSSSARPPFSSELNLLARAREDCEDSEESGLEDAEADAPQASQCSSDRSVSKEGFVTVKVSARRVCGRGRIAVILPHSCGRAPRDSSWRQRNPSPQHSAAQRAHATHARLRHRTHVQCLQLTQFLSKMQPSRVVLD